MTINDLREWEISFAEDLYARSYDSLPDSMMDVLWEYFEAGGTAREFNHIFSFGSNHIETKSIQKLLTKEYDEWEKSLL